MIYPLICEESNYRNAAAKQALRAAFGKKQDKDQSLLIDDVLRGSVLVSLINEGGALVGAFALADESPVLWVRAVAGRASVDLSVIIDQLVSRFRIQGRIFDSIGFQTQRQGAIKKGIKLGYQITGTHNGFTQMRKYL